MSIFVDENTKVVVQGFTGKQGSFYGLRNRKYGTQVVAGTSLTKTKCDVEGIPIFNRVIDAVTETGANTSFVVIPAANATSAILEAAEAGVALIICVTEHILFHEEVRMYTILKRNYPDIRLIGPNCSGVLSPGKANVGFTPTEVSLPGGPIGVISRSGTLAYQTLYELTSRGIGQTTCVGIGGDPVPGTNYIDCLQAFEADPETKGIVLIGEIGGSEEERAAEYIVKHITKPVVAYIAGGTAPAGKKMGHAGAITWGTRGSANSKIEALAASGVYIACNPMEIGKLMTNVLPNL